MVFPVLLRDASVLITGGSGFWGNAFVRRALRDGARRIVVLSRDEYKQHIMQEAVGNGTLRFFLGDVRDRDRLRIAFQDIDYVFHAAALKRIDRGEYDSLEFVSTNIIGTSNVLMAAAEVGVRKVIVLSSDKACSPVTLYGSTKSVAEHLVRTGQVYNPHGTKLACLRYGNVFNSRGSVVPMWRKMLDSGVTNLPVTNPGCTRFFFTVDDAIDFAIWVLGDMAGGELYVPKMKSFHVTDLAKAMGAQYNIIGMRGIEKLHEKMVSEEESPYFRIYKSRYVRFPDGVDKGDRLPVGFEYSSDKNDEWLSVDDLRRMLSEPELIAA